MKVGICQLNVCEDKALNLTRARDMLIAAADMGAELAILPEMFTVAYSPRLFLGAAESFLGKGGAAYDMLRAVSYEHKLAIIGGSVPELDSGRLFNTSMCFDSCGSFLGSYRKAHLFDVSYRDFSFRESDTVSGGNKPPLLLDYSVKTAVMICFDIRFPEWAQKASEGDVGLLALPAAFSVKTGPLHWELLLRARALDNRCYVAGVSPSTSKYAYGHSMLVSPEGEVIATLGEDEAVAVFEVDNNLIASAKASIPLNQIRKRMID